MAVTTNSQPRRAAVEPLAGYLMVSGALFGLQPIAGAMSCAIVSSIAAL
jgi:hypothetical protein